MCLIFSHLVLSRSVQPVLSMKAPLVSSLILSAFLLTGCQTPERLTDALTDRISERADALVEPTVSNTVRQASMAEPAREGNDTLPYLSGQVTLKEAQRIALAHNLTYRQALHALAAAKAQVGEARAEALPTIGLTAESSAMDPAPAGSDSDEYRISGTLTQALWRNGAVSLGIRAAVAVELEAQAAVEASRQQVLLNASIAYIDVLLDEKLVEVYESSVAVSERTLATARSRYARGAAANYEVLRAEVDLASARAELIEARNNHQNARIAFYRVLGVSQNSSLKLEDAMKEVTDLYEGAADAERTALTRRPEILQAHAALDAAQTAYQLARTEYGPSLDLFGRGDYARENSDGWEDSWTIGVTATYTLFDGFGRSSRVDAALAQAASAREALRIVEQNVLAETVAALLNVDYAREFNQTQSRNLELANEMVRIVEAGFRAGKNTQVEVLDARAALTQASGDFYRSAHAIASSLLQLRHATGTL